MDLRPLLIRIRIWNGNALKRSPETRKMALKIKEAAIVYGRYLIGCMSEEESAIEG